MQGEIEKAIEAVTQEAVGVVGSGRTDAGAHAYGQVIAFSTRSMLPAEVLCRAMNARLPEDIAVTSAEDIALDFHPRYDATSRVYRYLIWNRTIRSPFWLGRAAHVRPRLDERIMDQAARRLCGHRDFSAFVPATIEGSRRRTMYRAECRREGDLVIVELEANGFMKQMVRAIVGTLIQLGLGKIDLSEYLTILASGDRTLSGATAAAAGLYLVRVNYDESLVSSR